MDRKILITSLSLAIFFFLVSSSTALPIILDNNTTNENIKINMNYKITHTVFCEFASSINCTNCPETAEVLSQIYTSNDYDFEYITYVTNEHSPALDALVKHYNIAGYPTCFFDTGYEIAYNLTPNEFNYINKIEAAGNRPIHDLTIDLNITWFADCCNKYVNTNVTIYNNEDTLYEGILKLYVTEIKSRWNYTINGNNKSYHNTFIGFIAEDDTFYINPGSSITLKLPTFSALFPEGLEPNNMMIVAVVCNTNNAYKGYSDPPNNNHPFFVYKVDAVSKKKIKNSIEKPAPIQTIQPIENKLHNLERFLQGILLYEKNMIIKIVNKFINRF
ncbi:MAG: hypothetical protein A3K77_02770 [Euryarchaeota archaeon RBG_13_31_8]|nr:MAG: hypothetical protein A3K77_02770 [Euryarchaeota archaeon RBG_13_31_8]